MKHPIRIPLLLLHSAFLLLLSVSLVACAQRSTDPADTTQATDRGETTVQDHVGTDADGTSTMPDPVITEPAEQGTALSDGSGWTEDPLPADGLVNIAILSDVHIGKQNLSPMPEDKFASAIDQINELFGHTDGLIIAGDVVDRGYDWEYIRFRKVLAEHIQPTTRLSTIMGNHDYFRDGVVRYGGESAEFRKKCQDAYCGFLGALDTDVVVGGIHIIAVSVRDSALDYTPCTDFLIQHVRAAAEEDPTMPIILVTHEGIGDLFGTGGGTFDPAVRQLLNQYPQVITVSGHTHRAENDPRSIWQSSFTTVQLGTVGADFWNYSFLEKDQPENAAAASQGVLFSMTADRVVTMQRYDFTAGAPIGDAWIIDIPAVCASKKAFSYTDKRTSQAADPAFGADAAVTVTETRADSAMLTFPIAHVTDTVSDDCISFYHVTVKNKATGAVVYTAKLETDYYMGVSRRQTYDVSVTRLSGDTTYTFSVTAESAFGKQSEPLTCDFTTRYDPNGQNTSGNEPPLLLYVNYADGQPTDRVSGLACLSYGSPIIRDGVALLDKDSAYAYSLTDKEYAAMKNALAIETVMYINKDQVYPWGYVNLISNTESGGFGTSLSDTGYLKFSVHNGSGYVETSCKAPVGEWFHLVAACDGESLCLYINGELKARTAYSGSVKHVAAACRRLFVGADVNGTGDIQTSSDVKVQYFKLYGGGLTLENVQNKYNAASMRK